MSDLRSADALNHSPAALSVFAGAACGDASAQNALLAVAGSSAQKIDPDELAQAATAFPRGGWSATAPDLNHAPVDLARFADAACADESAQHALLTVAASSSQKLEPEELAEALVAIPRGGWSACAPDLTSSLLAFPRGATPSPHGTDAH